MSKTVRIKRRTTGAAGPPASLLNAELAFNEISGVMYYGKGLAAGTTAASIVAIGGSGAFVDLVGAQTVTGAKTFSGVVAFLAPVTALTPLAADNSTAVATTAFVKNQNYAQLVNGLIPASVLPAYVDDVLEYRALNALPTTGETGKIYVTLDTNKTYRWSGTTYIELTGSPGTTDAVPEGTQNLYFTSARAAAAAPIQSVAGRVGNVALNKTDVGLNLVDNTADMAKPVSTATWQALNTKANTTHSHAITDVTELTESLQSIDQAMTLKMGYGTLIDGGLF
jgi:hypothetical protein